MANRVMAAKRSKMKKAYLKWKKSSPHRPDFGVSDVTDYHAHAQGLQTFYVPDTVSTRVDAPMIPVPVYNKIVIWGRGRTGLDLFFTDAHKTWFFIERTGWSKKKSCNYSSRLLALQAYTLNIIIWEAEEFNASD